MDQTPLLGSPANLESYIQEIGYGHYQRKLFILCGLGWLIDNGLLNAISLILPNVQREFHQSLAVSGLGMTFAMIGLGIGATFWGYLLDTWGRKPVFLSTLLLTCIFTFSVGLTYSITLFCLSTLAMGFALGGNLPADGTIFLEFVPREQRSLLSLLSLFWPVGQLITSIFGRLILPNYSCQTDDCQSINNRGWRYLFACLGLFVLCAVASRRFWLKMYESPKFLVSQKKYKEAALVLEQLAQENGKQVQINPNALVGERMEETQDFHVLFEPHLRWTTILVWLIWMLTSLGYTMFNAFLPVFLQRMGSVQEAYDNYVLFALCGIPGSVLGMYASDTRLGRRGTMALSTFGTSLMIALFAYCTAPFWRIAASCLLAVLQNIMYGVLYAYSPEVFPIPVRGVAVGTASTLARVTGAIAPVLAGSLIPVHVTLPLYIASFSLFLTGILMAILPIETR
ncbi:major facilitator superfamily domain-containing protein [Gorgonomyces haynaldii]|nr:major facilitator superfamily domain-containing protein [Gorgonomyces haynaldii]